MSGFKHWRCLGAPIFTVAAVMLISACGSSVSDGGAAGGGTGSELAGTQIFLIAQVDTDGDSASDSVATIEGGFAAAGGSLTYNVFDIKPLDAGTDGSLNDTHKTYYNAQPLQWVSGGGDVWGWDVNTGDMVARVDNPSFQANREGLVGQGQVNVKSSAGTSNLPKELRDLLGRSQFTQEELAEFDICALLNSGGGVTVGPERAPADTIVHNMGYSPVGMEVTPDGKLAVFGVRQGDHLLVFDTDPDSPTFATPVSFVIQRTGEIKNKANTVVDNFTSQYAGFGGTAPGNLHTNRSGNATGGETDPETYVEPCDTAVILTAGGEYWFWSVDVEGDTLTGIRLDSAAKDVPEAFQVKVPLVDSAARTGTTSGLQWVGPWMGSLSNRFGGNEVLLHVENEGENSESIFDVTDPANVVEIERLLTDLASVKMAGGGTLAGPFVNNTVYAVNVDFTSTGGGANAVNYTYRSLAGDDLSGRSRIVTTAYLEKNNLADPGPRFILNGLSGRAGTSEGNVVKTTGSGVDTTVFSDEIWLSINSGDDNDIFQVVDISTAAPWLISEAVDLTNVGVPSQFGFKIGPDNRLYQVTNGTVQVVDVPTRSLTHTVRVLDPVTGSPWPITSVNLRAPSDEG